MLKKNIFNEFYVDIILNGEKYKNKKVLIEYKIDNNKKYYLVYYEKKNIRINYI